MNLVECIDMKSCRICLSNKKPLCPLFRYKLSGNYAEMLTALADVKVAANDGLPEKICLKCCTTLEKAYLLKTVAERSDKKLRKMLAKERASVPTKKIAFDSFTDIKSEIGPLNIKSEPSWEMEIEPPDVAQNISNVEAKDIVIANTVIRKVDPSLEDIKPEVSTEEAQITWKKSSDSFSSNADTEVEFLDEDVFQDDDDDDYVPPIQKTKTKFKKPKLSDIKVFKPVVRKVKVVTKMRDDYGSSRGSERPRSTTITCYPILKNGKRGSPILLKRPKDATVLKVHAGYKPRTTSEGSIKTVRRDKAMRSAKPAPPKQREKLVCPVCGILTYTLGNHITTHQEKKRYICNECPKTFSQKTNLQTHMKQHTGVKDHICEICGAGFYTQKSLVRHNLIHKGERPYGCSMCPKKFIAKAGLLRHEAIHTGEKRFLCQYCHKKFTQSHHLQNHMVTHTGAQPYVCEVCKVAFSYKVNLNNHVFKVHGINLKFKSIHTVTEDILRREMGMASETNAAIAHIMPQLGDVPTPGAHETVLSMP